MAKYLINILGPTASGKTALSIALAKHFKAEILSADSRQFYKEMNIGTAKPTAEELAQAPHHFINSHSISENYTAGKFEHDALQKIEELHEQNDVVIMVGGSGLYINAVLFGIDPFPAIPREVRLKTLHLYKNNGIQALRDEVRKYDPEFFLEVDLDNPRRLMRALEVCYATNSPYSSFRKQVRQERAFTPISLAYQWERADLYTRINTRVDQMLENGLIAEVQALHAQKHLPALDTIGYKEFFSFLEGQIAKEEAIDLVKRNSRRYAKRQLTWFKNDTSIHWFTPVASYPDIIAFAEQQMRNK